MKTTRIWAVILMLVACLGLVGCETLGLNEPPEESAVPDPMPPAPGPVMGYTDFEDVKIPPSMKIDRDNSFVYESDTIKAGTLKLAGRGSSAEVLNFFQSQLPQQGWALLSSFKYQKNVLIFTKPNKVCLVVAEPAVGINDMSAEVWVAPVRNGGANMALYGNPAPYGSNTGSFEQERVSGSPLNQPVRYGSFEKENTAVSMETNTQVGHLPPSLSGPREENLPNQVF